MHINKLIEPSSLLNATNMLEALVEKHSTNFGDVFSLARPTLTTLMAYAMKTHGYYFIKCAEKVNIKYAFAEKGMISLNDFCYLSNAFTLNNKYTKDELYLMLMQRQPSDHDSNIGFNIACLAQALSHEASAISFVKRWLHDLASGYSSDYVKHGATCKMITDLITIALQTLCESNASQIDEIKKSYQFVLADLANNYGFDPSDIY
jgi:hypothetical protein